MIYRAIRSLGDAVDIVRAAGEPNIGLIVDALHLARSGGTSADVAAIPRSLISHAQLCDARAVAAVSPAEEARGDRLLPGEGSLPLRDLLGALPADVPLALEIPVQALAPLPVVDRIRRAAASLGALSH